MKRPGFWLLLAAYLLACYWVFTRSIPLINQRPITLTFAHWQIERGPPDGFAAVIKRYEELHPRVRVVQLQIPGATIYPQWMRANLAGGTGPDLLEWGSWLEGQKDIPARYFTPLTSALAKPNPYNRGTSQEKITWEDTFHDGLLAPRRDSPDPGQIYAVNISEITWRLFCNAELLRAVTGSTALPKTYDDLRRIFAQVPEYGRRTHRPVSGLAGSSDNAWMLGMAVFAPLLLGVNQRIDAGGSLYLYNRQVLAAYLEGKWRFSEPAVKAGLRLMRESMKSMKPGFLQLRRDDAMIEFLRGEALFIFSGTWESTSLSQMAPFAIVPLRFPAITPDDPEVGRYIIGLPGEGIGETATSMYLNRASRHPAEALDFLQFLTSVPGNQIFTDHSLWLPSINGVVVPRQIRSFRDYQEGISFGQAPYDSIGSDVNLRWKSNFYELIGTDGSVDRFAATLDQVMPQAVRADLRAEMRNTLLLVKPQDAMIAGWAGRAENPADHARAEARQHDLESGQTMSEGLALQMKLTLDSTSLGKN